TGPTDTTQIDVMTSRTTSGSGLETGTWTFDYRISGPGGSAAGMIATLPSGAVIEYGYAPSSDNAALAGGWTLVARIVWASSNGPELEFEERTYEALRAARPNMVWYTPE